MSDKMNENYKAKDGPMSRMLKGITSSRLSALWGWRASRDKEKVVDLLKVDVKNRMDVYNGNNQAEPFAKGGPITEKLEELFQKYLADTVVSQSDLSDRMRRINELDFADQNEPIISRTVNLVADEAVQLDDQNVLVDVETPNPLLKLKIHQLIQKWGITPGRIRSVCHDLELYGESFWANKVTDNGIERINPIHVKQVKERIEFNPINVMEKLDRIKGFQSSLSKESKLALLVKNIEESSMSDFSDLFDTKLFGYSIQDDMVIPPWNITHFRHNAEASEFFPHGRPPLINCLAPFKQLQSTITLQGLARIMSFPVQLYEVKTNDSMDEAKQWEVVNRVREQYENIGVVPTSGSAEVYSVNTRMYAPEGLVKLSMISGATDIDFVGDIEIYIDRVSQATGVPKGYLVQEFGGWGNSGISLIEQNKPFARHVFSIQTSFLEGLTDLIRMHFAITNEFPINEQFMLSMKFPTIEMGEERTTSRNSSLELATSVFDTITAATGADSPADLPQDVVKDILAKYTFLKPEDIAKWVVKTDSAESEDDEEDSFFDTDEGGDSGGGNEEDEIGDALADDDISESIASDKKKKILREKLISSKYQVLKEKIFFDFLESKSITEWSSQNKHYKMSTVSSSILPILEVLKKQSPSKLKEDELSNKTLKEHFQEMRNEADNGIGGRII